MGDIAKDSTSSTGKLAAAVSNAGGMGTIGGGTMTVEQLGREIADARALTAKPFGVDLFFPAGAAPSLGTMAEVRARFPKEHIDFVEGLWGRFGIKRAQAPQVKIMDEELSKNQWKLVLDANVPYIALGLGTPDWLIREAHDRGMKVISLVGAVRAARGVAEMGSDFIVAQGTEGGGHTGRIGLMSLLPQVVDAVSPIPVLAAGGMTVGSQLAAALTLGAVGVWVGTAFEATFEGPLLDAGKQRLVDATDDSTLISKLYTGKTARGLRAPLSELWEKEGPPTLPMPHQHYLVRDFLYAVEQQDKTDLIMVGAGQGSGLIKEIRSAQQVVDDMVQGAIEALVKKVPANVTIQL
jgi:NAD(P)H-dependent flavin oxidoreductase YrpB (nitropropane dioxygenase family)